jgi:Tfp pilus assembly protein PilF
MIHATNTTIWRGATFLLVVLAIGGCASPSHSKKDAPLLPPKNANSLAAQRLVEGNQLFAEHQWTAAIGKYEEAVQAQPKLAEAHYNLGVALYRKGPVAAARPHFIKAANLAPGHPVIWNAPPFRKYGNVESADPEPASDGHMGHQH